jgi:V/A-type H+-transporting ATPase subunit I
MHLADCSEVEDWARDLSAVQVDETIARVGALEKKIRGLAREMGMGELPRTIAASAQCMGLEEIEGWEKKVAGVEAEVSGLLLARDSKNQEIEKLLRISAELKTFAPLGRMGAGVRYSFLSVETGRVRRQNVPLLERALSQVPHVIMPLAVEGETVTLAAIALRKDGAALDGALRDAAFERVTLPAEIEEFSEDAQKEVSARASVMRRELSVVEEEIAAARRRYRAALAELSGRINCTKLLSRARAHFRRTGSACLISGWVPEAQVAPLSTLIEEAARGHCYIEVRSPGEVPGVKAGAVKVPVLFRNPFFARPFEILTAGYGIPSYDSIEPTVFVAVTFLIMFGVMFGDIGEGLSLMLIGGVLVRRRSAQLMKIGSLIFYCGFSSLIFGFFYGSFFGVERWFAPLWIRPMSDVMFFLRTAVYFGIAMVSLGIVINIVNALRTRDWVRGLFDKSGLLAGVIYWGSVGLITNALLLKGRGAHPAVVLLVVGVPVLLLFLKAPVARLAGRSPRLFPEGALTYFMETIIEVVEIFMGFLANTLSFIRVAAFALAHAMLFMAVFSVADAVRGAPGGPLLSAAVVVVGNAIIIVLEGLIVTIQAIRLEYYEFFGKFFSPEGTRYEPVRIVE